MKVFLENVSIHSSLKGYKNEKCAQNIASRLEGSAFDVYMRLGNKDKKNTDKVKEELLNEFEWGKPVLLNLFSPVAHFQRQKKSQAHYL